MENEKNPKNIITAVKNALSVPGDHLCRNDPQGVCPVTSVMSAKMIFDH